MFIVDRGVPCYICKERNKYGACHDTCSRYLIYKEKLQEAAKLRQEARLAEPCYKKR